MPITDKEMQDFITDVTALRVAQKQYFKTRDTQWLNESKRLERKVDDWISDNFKQGKLC